LYILIFRVTAPKCIYVCTNNFFMEL
jgi:hypothetical protein